MTFPFSFQTLRRVILAFTLCAYVAVLRAEPDDHAHHDDHASHDDDDGHDDHEDGPLQLSTEIVGDFGIEFAVAGPGTISRELRLLGEIQMNSNKAAHVSPRFAGVAKTIARRLGDQVKAGEVLALMETNDTLRPYELTAPIAGTIVEFHLAQGESVDAGDYTYIIADTSTVWADLRVPQRQLPRLKVGLDVYITAGREFPAHAGKISYIGPVIDEHTRTGLVRAELDNSDGLLRPGLFIVGNVSLGRDTHSIVVPLSAVHTIDNASVVFVEDDHDEGFEPRMVQLGEQDLTQVHITDGLSHGERYVSVGGFFLKAELQKEDFGDGHAH
jgi:cobalt-zinc-cadmium efflux system membrane fusion protein